MTNSNGNAAAALSWRRLRNHGFGGPELLAVETSERPEPGPGEARIVVEASSITTSDSIVRRGLNPYMGDLQPPFTLGYDLVGYVDALGPDAADFQVGDRVVAITRWGSNADAVVLPVGKLTAVRTTLDAVLIEPMVMTGATAAAMVRQISPVRPGQVVYVEGASGGVGLLAVQAALLLGATVIASASPGKHAALRAAGAQVFDYRDSALAEKIRAVAPNGVDLVLDAGGGNGIRRAEGLLADRGTLISFGFAEASRRNGSRSPEVLAAAGSAFEAAAAMIARINASPRGLRAVQFDITGMREAHPDGYASDVAWLLEQVKAGRLAPMARAVAMDEAAAAHRALDAGEVTGRLVLDHRL